MDTVLAAAYFMTVGGMGWNLIKIKLQNDYESEIKDYREYDLSHERIKIGTDKIDPDGKYIVLANHKATIAEATSPAAEHAPAEPVAENSSSSEA